MKRILTALIGLLHMFGGLIVYWIVLLAFGVKPAIAAALLFILVEGVWRITTRRPFPPMWWMANGIALVFGAIDLYARTPFMIKYEGAIGNLVTAGVFAAGALGKVPLVMQFARQRAPDIPDRPGVVRYFRAFTWAWALYFVARAGAFLWIMAQYPLVEAIAIRTVVGWVSLGVMLLISINGRRVFDLCRRFGLFADAQGPAA